MNRKSRRGSPTQALSSGNIVSIALQLYRANGNNYFLTSLLAHLWFFLLGFGAVVLGIVLVIPIVLVRENSLMAAGVILVGVALAIIPTLWIVGRFSASGGLISRQMFMVLRQQDEPIATARTELYARTWVFAKSNVWVGLTLFLVYLGLALVGYVLYLGLWPILTLLYEEVQKLEPQQALIWFALLTVLVLILLLGAILAVSYIAARLFFVDVVLALEPEVTALQSLNRSWQLTRNYALQTLTVISIAFIIVTPATILANIANLLFIIPVLGLLINVALFPFWQGIKAVMYYDLRRYNEGLTLDLETAERSPAHYLKRVILQTPESVELDFALGGIGSRAYAWMVDQICIYTGLFLLFLLGIYLYVYALYPALLNLFPNQIGRIEQWSVALTVLLAFVLYNGYYIIFETLWQGQTPGKRLAQIRVVRDNGQPIGLKEAALRSLIQAVDFYLFYIGGVLITFTASEKRLGDMAAGTLVIQNERSSGFMAATKPQVAEPIRRVAAELLHQANLNDLSADQYLTLRNFLQQRSQLSPPARLRSAVKLATQVREVIFAPEAIPTYSLSDEDFLEAVALAYRQSTLPDPNDRTP